MTALDKEVYRLNAQKERLEESIEAKINYMWNEYEITLSDAAALRNEEMNDLTVMKRDAAAIKDAIKESSSLRFVLFCSFSSFSFWLS